MKKIIAILLSLIFVVSLCSCSSDDDKIRFGAAGIGGIYNETVTSIRQLADESGKLKIEQKTTAGSAANVRLLSQGYLDAAIAQSDIVIDCSKLKETKAVKKIVAQIMKLYKSKD